MNGILKYKIIVFSLVLWAAEYSTKPISTNENLCTFNWTNPNILWRLGNRTDLVFPVNRALTIEAIKTALESWRNTTEFGAFSYLMADANVVAHKLDIEFHFGIRDKCNPDANSCVFHSNKIDAMSPCVHLSNHGKVDIYFNNHEEYYFKESGQGKKDKNSFPAAADHAIAHAFGYSEQKYTQL